MLLSSHANVLNIQISGHTKVDYRLESVMTRGFSTENWATDRRFYRYKSLGMSTKWIKLIKVLPKRIKVAPKDKEGQGAGLDKNKFISAHFTVTNMACIYLFILS
jgi:hypothetical protein